MSMDEIVIPVSPVVEAQQNADVAALEASTAVMEAQADQAIAEARAGEAMAEAVAENAPAIVEAQTEEIDDVWLEGKFSEVRNGLSQLSQEVMTILTTLNQLIMEMTVNLAAVLTIAAELKSANQPPPQAEPTSTTPPAQEPSNLTTESNPEENAEGNRGRKTASKTKSIRL